MIVKPLIRCFQPSDLRRILKIEEESFGLYAWPAEVFGEYAGVTPNLFLVAMMGRHIAGYSITTFARGTASLDSIAVLSKYRARGVGNALLKSTIRKVKRLNARTIWLMVRPANRSAIAFYEHRGFRHTSTVAEYYEDCSAGWRMRLALT